MWVSLWPQTRFHGFRVFALPRKDWLRITRADGSFQVTFKAKRVDESGLAPPHPTPCAG